MKAMGESGLRTINEMRRLDNMPPLPGGDVAMRQAQYVPITELGSTKSPALTGLGAIMTVIRKTLSFDETEIKFTGDGNQGIFEGYASVFGNVDSDGDIILPGAYKNTLTNRTRKVAMFFNHRAWELLASDAFQEDSKGLFVDNLHPATAVHQT
jgi:hypothetical protein